MNKRLSLLLVLLSISFNLLKADTASKKDSLLKVYTTASDTQKVNILNDLSTLALDNTPEEALKYGNEALAISKRINFKRGISISLNSIGLFYYYIDNYQQAIVFLKQSIENSIKIEDELLIAISNLRLADVYLYMEDYETSIQYFEKCIPVFELRHTQKLLKDASNDMAIAHYYMGNYEKSLEYYLLTLKTCEQIGSKSDLPPTLTGIGNVYLSKSNYPTALKYYHNALKVSNELHSKDDAADALINIGNVYRLMKDYKKALEYYLNSAKTSADKKDTKLANIYMNIGLVYTKINEYPKALKYFDMALKINKDLGAKNGMASTLINIGVLFGKQKEYINGITSIEEGIAIAKEINNKDFIKSGYEELALLYSETNEFEKAYQYHKLYGDLKDTLLNEANSKAIAEMQTKYETDKKEQAIKALTLDNELQGERQKKERTTFLAIGVVVLIIILFVLYGYIAKQKANKVLEEKNTAINKQKEQIEKQKDLVDQKNHEITDSINYAKKIQEAILPSQKFVKDLLPESFVYFQPKDIVSGDFYWFAKRDHITLFAAADCTGHGVPGALMSMVGSNILNEIVNEKGITQPNEILNHLHKGVRTALKQDITGTESRDGMDIALCAYNEKDRTLHYAGANRSLYIVKANSLEITKANKMPIGGLQLEGEDRRFTSHDFKIEEENMIYLCSDGYADQFGGDLGKKFMETNFKKLLLQYHNQPIAKQLELFRNTINNWKGSLEQIDDILVIGVKISVK